MATYRANPVGFARLMKSDEIGDHVKSEAEKMAEHLRTSANAAFQHPTGTYVSNFEVETGLDVLERDRSAAFVINDTAYATVLEVGAAWMRNPPQPMTKLLSSIKDR